ncbi:hypothetical protein RRG08_032396 [Elysia crispata]|uniref:Uncharacterized protein n=1 Tax=Elysia crispata TaxID=231223 RepID=A0AAE1CQA9_9GAST|nr:hypothetical protein RRG08_032396 [Elysia crispata]
MKRSVQYFRPQQVSADHGRRNGGSTADKAYNGTNFKFYYHTPVEFYSSGRVDKDPADTAKAGAGVLDKSGQVRMMSSSGVRIRTPEIEGVGVVRTRYPIMPVHGKGAPVWKEFNAMKGMTMHMNRYASLFEERPGQMSSNGCATDLQGLLHFQMSLTHMDPPGEHNHDFYINSEELDELKRGVHTMVTSSMDMGHEHELELVYRIHVVLAWANSLPAGTVTACSRRRPSSRPQVLTKPRQSLAPLLHLVSPTHSWLLRRILGLLDLAGKGWSRGSCTRAAPAHSNTPKFRHFILLQEGPATAWGRPALMTNIEGQPVLSDLGHIASVT